MTRPESNLRWLQRVALLHDLRLGPDVYGELVAGGRAAVTPLEALLRGPTETVEQPRQLAAEILDEIAYGDCSEAVAALRHALEDSLSHKLSPLLRASEDLIASIIARRLGRAGDVEALPVLLRGLRARRLPGCAEALAALQHKPAIPLLIDCLEDDVARADAMAALIRFEMAAVPALTRRLRRHAQYPGQTETLARACAAQVLGD